MLISVFEPYGIMAYGPSLTTVAESFGVKVMTSKLPDVWFRPVTYVGLH